jgi:hypothetical protein
VPESLETFRIELRIATANGAPVAGDIGFSYATVQESATPNVDYAHAVGASVVLAGTANESLITVNLPIGNDAVAEPAETFRIEIGVVPPGTSQVPMTRVTISDDDGASARSLSTSETGRDAAARGGTPGTMRDCIMAAPVRCAGQGRQRPDGGADDIQLIVLGRTGCGKSKLLNALEDAKERAAIRIPPE